LAGLGSGAHYLSAVRTATEFAFAPVAR
jgi:hypothetical protein